jgi:uncharacterized RmlC-like cupin family protein
MQLEHRYILLHHHLKDLTEHITKDFHHPLQQLQQHQLMNYFAVIAVFTVVVQAEKLQLAVVVAAAAELVQVHQQHQDK